MFTVPSPPAPGHPGPPGSSFPLAPSFSPPVLPSLNPKQITVRTRSIGTNTQDGVLEGDSACLGPCQPGTSVNLEGIVWHETEEGRKPLWMVAQLECVRIKSRFLESTSSCVERCAVWTVEFQKSWLSFTWWSSNSIVMS